LADLEGIARIMLEKHTGDEAIIEHLQREIKFYKGENDELNAKLAAAVLFEVKKSIIDENSIREALLREILLYPKSNVTMQSGGIGCRGEGDFIVHQKLADIAATVDAKLGVKDLDDAGVVENSINNAKYILTKIEGMHSRLSEFPFLSGFHVARAALRDILVKGGTPTSLMVDLHLGDDGDVGKLLDYVAGCAVVSKLVNVPITAGSTLRIGGDMVIGTRLTGCVAAVGIAEKILPRKNLREGQAIIMTKGAGGGTIATAAIFSGNHAVIKHTMNIDFAKTVKAIQHAGMVKQIDCMIDVTNGGIRNELNESISNLDCGIEISRAEFFNMINADVLKMLQALNIDPLGISIGSLLVFCQVKHIEEVLQVIKNAGVEARVVGRVISKKGLFLINENGIREKLTVKRREAAYTPVKMMVEGMKLDLEDLNAAWEQSKRKVDLVYNHILADE